MENIATLTLTHGLPSQRLANEYKIFVIVGSQEHLNGLADMVRLGYIVLSRIYTRYGRLFANKVREILNATIPAKWTRRIR